MPRASRFHDPDTESASQNVTKETWTLQKLASLTINLSHVDTMRDEPQIHLYPEHRNSWGIEILMVPYLLCLNYEPRFDTVIAVLVCVIYFQLYRTWSLGSGIRSDIAFAVLLLSFFPFVNWLSWTSRLINKTRSQLKQGRWLNLQLPNWVKCRCCSKWL